MPSALEWHCSLTLRGFPAIESSSAGSPAAYLLNWGTETVSRCSHRKVRAESIAFTEMVLRLGRTPRSELRTLTI